MDRSRINKSRKRNAGVTLLEVMVVLAIIALIASLAAPRLLESFGRAKSQAAKIQLSNVRAAVQLFYIDVGRYPSEAEGLSALIERPSGATNWAGPYLSDDDLKDPWGRYFFYRHPGAERDFDLLTYGRDGQPGGTKEDSDINL